MPFVNPLYFLQKAREKGIAIAAFNVHNLETIQAVVEGAAEERSPVMIQTTPGTLKHAGIPYVAACVKEAAKLYDIPIALHVDHCPSYETIIQCIQHGYTSVMIDGSGLPYEENVALVSKVVETAHYAGVAVEGELGRIGGTEDDMTVDDEDAFFTVPSEAREFVAATGIDFLAVAIGTAHGVYKGEPKLDFERLAQIAAATPVPLVLHGASGVSDEAIRKAVPHGICKINIDTELRVAFSKAVQEVVTSNPKEIDPRKLLGPAREAMKEVVRAKMRLFGCAGQA